MTITEQRPRGEGRGRPGQSLAPLAGAGTFAVFGLVDIFVFGLFAHHGDVTFAFLPAVLQGSRSRTSRCPPPRPASRAAR
jgi:hypothetical protein